MTAMTTSSSISVNPRLTGRLVFISVRKRAWIGDSGRSTPRLRRAGPLTSDMQIKRRPGVGSSRMIGYEVPTHISGSRTDGNDTRACWPPHQSLQTRERRYVSFPASPNRQRPAPLRCRPPRATRRTRLASSRSLAWRDGGGVSSAWPGCPRVQISEPAPLITEMETQRNHRLGCIWMVGRCQISLQWADKDQMSPRPRMRAGREASSWAFRQR